MKLSDVAGSVELLKHPLSAKRRSAAKALRKLQDATAGPALLEALERELRDPRTWETQYQMIMALGACRYRPAASFLEDLAIRPFDATMIYLAVGDAMLRIAEAEGRHWQLTARLLDTANADVLYGACQAIAMLRLMAPREIIEQLIDFAERYSLDESQGPNRRFCVAAAMPGWLDESPRVRPFLSVCTGSKNEQLRAAAEAALLGRYTTLHPL